MLKIWFVVNTLLWSSGIEIGGSLLPLNLVLLLPVGVIWLSRRLRISKTTLVPTVILVIFLILSLYGSRLGPCENLFIKAILSAPLLTLILIIGMEIGSRATPEDWLDLRSTAFWTMITAFIFIVAEIFFPQLFSPNKSMWQPEYRFSGIYNEPSHVAISLFPCVAILLSSNDKSLNRKGLFSLLFLFLASRSSTLIMLTFCYITYRLAILGRLKQSLKFITVVAVVIVVAITMNYELLVAPTVNRIIGVTSSANENLSSLVYLKGWQDALANTARTYGFGLGFNMMGCSPLPDIPLRPLFDVPERSNLNNEDGSFLFSKLLSEFGIFGFAFFAWVIISWIRYEYKSRSWTTGMVKDVSAVHNALIFSFVTSSLLRSTGYFQGGLLLWATAAIGATTLAKREHLQHDV